MALRQADVCPQPLVRCVGQVMAQPATQPSVQNPFERGAPRQVPTPEQARRAPTGPGDAEIAKRLLAESIAHCRGSCAYPYKSDRASRLCGRRSAYHHLRNDSPLSLRHIHRYKKLFIMRHII